MDPAPTQMMMRSGVSGCEKVSTHFITKAKPGQSIFWTHQQRSWEACALDEDGQISWDS